MKSWLVLSLLLIACRSAAGQAAEYAEPGMLTPRVRSFPSSTYGAENQNWDVTQSPEGILYVANSSGVLVFDGLDWTVRQLPKRPTVRAVAWAGGRLYVGGYGEFGYFRAQDGQLGDYVSLSAALPPGEQGEEIWHIEPLTDGSVVYQSFSRIYRLSGDSLGIEQPGSLMFAHATGDSLLVPVTGRGIRLDVSGGAAVLLPGSDPGGAAVVGITGPAAAPLLATQDRIYRYRDGQLQPWSEGANARLAGQQINRILALRNGEVAVGTIMSGVYVFAADGREQYHLSFGDGLTNNTVLALFEDLHGDLWAGLDRGIDLIVRSEPLRYYRQGEQPIGAVYAATRYREGLYIGTNQGLFIQDVGQRNFTLIPGTAGQVWELRATPYGLLCGHNAGTFLVEDRRARLLTNRSGGWQTIPFPPDSSKLLQANYTGLSILDPGTAAAASAGAEVKLDGLLAPLRFLARTGERELLALHGSRGGYRIHFSADWRRIVTVDTIATPDLIRPLLTRFGDTLLIQTREESYRYRDGTFTPIATFRGVPLPPDSYCLPGRPGTRDWFLVGRERVTAYRGAHAAGAYPLALRHNFPDIVALTDSSYLICLEDGFATYHPAEEAIPAVHLRLGLTVATDSIRQPLTEGELRIPYHANNPHFNYALPALDRPVHYRYRLLGFSERWSEWSDSGDKEFTNLDEGDYRFQVEADWYGAEAEIAFTVLPPWYRTPLAYLAYALLVTGLLYLLYHEHRTRLRAQARKLEALRQRQLQRQRIEARNEQLEADVQRKSRELANSTLTLAKKNEMLLDLKEELSRLGERGTPSQDSHKLLRLIDRNLNNEEDWAIFESHFNEVHEAFLKRIRKTHPQLTAGDLQLAAFLRMDLSSKDIAPLMHISVRGVENKRYRLRKKIGLEGSDHLNQYLQDF